MATAEQRASAYSKFNFGIGMNISCEKANTSCLGGLFKSGPGPCCGAPCCGGIDGGYGDFGGMSYGAPGMAQGGMASPGFAGVSYPPAAPVQPMPVQAPQMPKADAQPVGYWTTTPQYNYGYGYYPYQPMWYGNGCYGYYGY